MNEEVQARLQALLEETGRAHHAAFAASDGVDEDWPIWYADYLVDRVKEQLGLEISRSQLI